MLNNFGSIEFHQALKGCGWGMREDFNALESLDAPSHILAGSTIRTGDEVDSPVIFATMTIRNIW